MTWRSEVFTTPGSSSWDVPVGVSAVMAVIIGAGAGGSGNKGLNSASQHGGANGEILSGVIVPCTSGGTLSIVVGAGGTGRSTDWNVPGSGPGEASAIEGGGGNSSVGIAIALGAPSYVGVGGYGDHSPGGGPLGGPVQVGGANGIRGSRENLLWWGGNGPTSALDDVATILIGVGDGGRLVGGEVSNGPGFNSRQGGATSATVFGPGTDGGAGFDTSGTDAATSAYGVGGSGSGANSIGLGNPLSGGDGAGGYVAIFWAEP